MVCINITRVLIIQYIYFFLEETYKVKHWIPSSDRTTLVIGEAVIKFRVNLNEIEMFIDNKTKVYRVKPKLYKIFSI